MVAAVTFDLTGDRDVECGYVIERLGELAGKSVLDFGCGSGFLSLAAARAGANVLAIDLLPLQFQLLPNIEFRHIDVMDVEGSFDLVMNCSTIEHVGLAGRFEAQDEPDGDIEAMGRLKNLLTGQMILTLPVGRDAVYSPLHRVYGAERLPRLLEGYNVVESSYFHKLEGNRWVSSSYEDALSTQGSESYYALGTMVLQVCR